MKSIICLLLVAVAFAVAQNPSVSFGVARMVGTTSDSGITGLITFLQVGDMVNITVNLTGITVNTNAQHGIHVHEFGDVFLPSGASVGSHWNPYGQPHGCPFDATNVTRHLGDTGNWQVAADGTLVASKLINLMALTGNNSIIGFGVIFHSLTDDCLNTTSSGARLAQGVVGVGNPNYFQFPAYNNSQNTALPPNQYAGLTNAVCNFQNAAGTGISGWVRFSQATPSDSVTVTAKINGLVSGSLHGFHVHQYGDLTTFDGNAAGAHYTGPVYDSTKPHSIPGSGFTKHNGDMGNLYFYDANGVAYYNNSFTDIGLWGTSNNVIGRAVLIHALVDNCAQPLGAAGARWAFCVIGPMNPANNANYTIDASINVPSTQNSTFCVAATTGSSGSTTALTTAAASTTASTTGSSGVLTTGTGHVTTSAERSFGTRVEVAVVISAIFAMICMFF